MLTGVQFFCENAGNTAVKRRVGGEKSPLATLSGNPKEFQGIDWRREWDSSKVFCAGSR